MSRTKRKKVNFNDDFKEIRHKRLKPYLADKEVGQLKFKVDSNNYTNGYIKSVSATDKLVTRNANRSRKKAMRQQSRDIINQELNK